MSWWNRVKNALGGSAEEPGGRMLVENLRFFEDLGSFTLDGVLAVGETELEEFVPVRSGRWRAFHLDDSVLNDLVEEGRVPEEAPEQLLLVHEGREVPKGRRLPALRDGPTVSIHAARFTAGDSALAKALRDPEAFYDLLDGQHGILERGNGLSLGLSGDGRAVLYLGEGQDEATLVLVELL